MTWNDVAEVCLDAIAHSPPSHAHTAARTFAATTLEALRARFGGRDDTRALVEALYDTFPRAAALVASPASDETQVAPIRARYSNAAWHLRTLRPRAQRWTRTWADRVAHCFAALDTTAPRLVACAPHLGAPDMASWSIVGITDTLSLHAFCTSGVAFGGHRARAWIALRAPNLNAHGVFEAREQRAALDALPETTRTWLQSATPVHDVPGVWRWLCVGTPTTLARGFSFDDDARRTARALYEQLSPHLDALRVGFCDPSLRLYSCDLDPDHLLPHDSRDRDELALNAYPNAERVCIVTRTPTQHPYELRRACTLGTALGAAFGATRTFVYDYAPVASRAPMHPTIVVLSLDVFRAPDDASLEASVATVFEALARGALLVLLDARHDAALAQRHLGVLLDAPAEATAWRAGATRVVRAFDAPWVNAARPELVSRWWQSLVARAPAV
jgi:hypothetical protein